MRKKTGARIAGTVMAAVVAVTQLGVLDNIRVFAEETNSLVLTPEMVTLQDADFESNVRSGGIWKVNTTASGSYTMKNEIYANEGVAVGEKGGTCGINFWFPDACNFSLTQYVDVLPAGEYTLTSYVMGWDADVSLILSGADNNIVTTAEAVALEGNGIWQEITTTFEVKADDTNVTVGFYGDVKAGGWGHIDHLKIEGKSKDGNQVTNPVYTVVDVNDYIYSEENLVSNGDFETGDTTGWNITDNNVKYCVKTDEWSVNKTNFLHLDNKTGSDKKFVIARADNINLTAGTYLLSVDTHGDAATSHGLFVSLGTTGAEAAVVKQLEKTTGWNEWKNTSVAFTLNQDDVATLTISGDISNAYWGDIDNIKLVKATGVNDNKDDESNTDDDSTIVDAEVFVDKIAGLDEDFITGADVSSYLSLVNSGAKFYDKEGNELDNQGFFNLLAAGGTNYIRLRVWNNPYDANGNGYGGGNNDLEAAKVMGQWATDAGMKVLIDFHFSDFWADPAKQQAPKAWVSIGHDEKKAAISEYTTTSLKYLLDAGVDVGMVQIGNETTNGFCGETYSDNGWSDVCELFNSGCKAVRNVASDYNREIQVALHFTNPEKAGLYANIAQKFAEYNVDYDVFASSYYPYWHGTISNLTNVLSNIANTYGKKVMVAETSWATTLEDGDGHENTVREGSNDTCDASKDYDFSLQGQADEIAAVAKAVKNVGDAGIGLFYWEAAWIPVEYSYDEDGKLLSDVVDSNKLAWERYGSGWASSYAGNYDPEDAGKWYGGSAVDNQSWFGFDGKALDTVNIYNYIRTGAKAQVRATSATAEAVSVETSKVDDIVLPDKATVKYNNKTTESVSVTWNTDDIEAAKKAGVGTYTIKGVCFVQTEAGTQEVEATFKLTIEHNNLLSNASFEDGLEGWKVSSEIINIEGASSNSRTGNGCAHFYSTTAGESATATQTVKLPAGKYALTGYIQGGNVGDSDIYSIKAIVGDKTYSAEGELTGWKVWSNPTIDEIVITEDNTEVQIVLSIENTTAGVWGSFDDIALYKVADIENSKDNTTDDGTNTDNKDDVSGGASEEGSDTADKDDVSGGVTDDGTTGDSISDNKEDIEVRDSDDEYIKTESFFTETVEKVIAKFSESVEVVIEEVRTVTNSGISIAGDKSILLEGVKFEVSSVAKTTDSYKKAETKLAEKKLDGEFTVQEINLKGADGTQLHQMDGYVVVTLPVPEGFTVSASKTIGVYRLEDDGTLTKCASDVVDGKLSFSTNHFSTYIFVEEPVVVADVPAENNGNSTGNVSAVANATPVESATPTALTSVKTGDETDFLSQMMFVLAGIALVTLALVHTTRKKISI